MRLLFIHVDKIKYKVKRETKVAEEITPEQREGRMDDCLLTYACVERIDEKDKENVIKLVAKEITAVAESVKTKNITVFPFAHLSPQISAPETAVSIIKDVEKTLASSGFNVMHVPFGWNKEFELKSKGHPMAVLSRTICPHVKGCKVRCPSCDWPIDFTGEKE